MILDVLDQIPILEGEKVLLRPLSLDDVPSLFKLRSNKTMMQFIDRPIHTTENDTQDLIQKILDDFQLKKGITWAITIKPEHKLVGTIGFWRMDEANFRTEIGYMIDIPFQSKGYTKEACCLAIDLAFKNLNIHSIEANVKPGNIKSESLLYKLGFKKEAYFRENFYFNGVFLDSVIYCLLESDFSNSNH
ncbi:MAG TPA: GNAT family protein [Saprospiraceae bacterium]|nr:GNAT family protein [Saprospiraceae bacterium]